MSHSGMCASVKLIFDHCVWPGLNTDVCVREKNWHSICAKHDSPKCTVLSFPYPCWRWTCSPRQHTYRESVVAIRLLSLSPSICWLLHPLTNDCLHFWYLQWNSGIIRLVLFLQSLPIKVNNLIRNCSPLFLSYLYSNIQKTESSSNGLVKIFNSQLKAFLTFNSHVIKWIDLVLSTMLGILKEEFRFCLADRVFGALAAARWVLLWITGLHWPFPPSFPLTFQQI